MDQFNGAGEQVPLSVPTVYETARLAPGCAAHAIRCAAVWTLWLQIDGKWPTQDKFRPFQYIWESIEGSELPSHPGMSQRPPTLKQVLPQLYPSLTTWLESDVQCQGQGQDQPLPQDLPEEFSDGAKVLHRIFTGFWLKRANHQLIEALWHSSAIDWGRDFSLHQQMAAGLPRLAQWLSTEYDKIGLTHNWRSFTGEAGLTEDKNSNIGECIGLDYLRHCCPGKDLCSSWRPSPHFRPLASGMHVPGAVLSSRTPMNACAASATISTEGKKCIQTLLYSRMLQWAATLEIVRLLLGVGVKEGLNVRQVAKSIEAHDAALGMDNKKSFKELVSSSIKGRGIMGHVHAKSCARWLLRHPTASGSDILGKDKVSNREGFLDPAFDAQSKKKDVTIAELCFEIGTLLCKCESVTNVSKAKGFAASMRTDPAACWGMYKDFVLKLAATETCFTKVFNPDKLLYKSVPQQRRLVYQLTRTGMSTFQQEGLIHCYDRGLDCECIQSLLLFAAFDRSELHNYWLQQGDLFDVHEVPKPMTIDEQSAHHTSTAVEEASKAKSAISQGNAKARSSIGNNGISNSQKIIDALSSTPCEWSEHTKLVAPHRRLAIQAVESRLKECGRKREWPKEWLLFSEAD